MRNRQEVNEGMRKTAITQNCQGKRERERE